ncbi:hypothetical protein M7I_2002 [Glarea lozoyensis 74030]|uniref:Uncharacterized protein n=1 Tax=Glarea lozoyensis (strain ATCC 74030 / MF5533) TaxID=1104152 RepID=H0EHL8_GLAL7|nr:hypothetical protein M7I_2002 [Glarea lozoyensis 74030]
MSDPPTTPTTCAAAKPGSEPVFCNHLNELEFGIKRECAKSPPIEAKVTEAGTSAGETSETAGGRMEAGTGGRERRGSTHNWKNYDEVVAWSIVDE